MQRCDPALPPVAQRNAVSSVAGCARDNRNLWWAVLAHPFSCPKGSLQLSEGNAAGVVRVVRSKEPCHFGALTCIVETGGEDWWRMRW